MFFDSWMDLWRIVAVGIPTYLLLIVFLIVSGKRTLSKMNSFDFVITIALGSTVATILLSKDVSMSEGLVALALLIFLQFIITALSARSDFVKHLVKQQPALIYHRSDFLWDVMHSERVTEEEIRQAVRSQGIASLEDVEAIVLETDGTFSILKSAPAGPHSALANVRHAP